MVSARRIGNAKIGANPSLTVDRMNLAVFHFPRYDRK
jgi:hypothetical protein